MEKESCIVPYARQLKMMYSFDGEKAVFPDKVTYTMPELLFLSSVDDKDLQSIHIVKKIFDGEIIIDE